MRAKIDPAPPNFKNSGKGWPLPKPTKRASNTYHVAGVRSGADGVRGHAAAARVDAVAETRARNKSIAASAGIVAPEAPRRSHQAKDQSAKDAGRYERRQRRAQLEIEMEESRMRSAATKRAAREKREAQSFAANCTICVSRPIEDAPPPAFRKHHDGNRQSMRPEAMRPAVDADGFANLTLKVFSRSGKGGRGVRRDEFASSALYLFDPAALDGPVTSATLTNIVPGSPDDADFERELVRFCRAVSQLEADCERTTSDGQRASHFKHVIIPLPAGLARNQRRWLMRELTAEFESQGLPYLAAIHRPSNDGDQRNHHLHIALSNRQFVRRGPRSWSFAPTKDQEILDSTGIQILRQDAVAAFNIALADAQIDVRFTATTRAERGLTRAGAKVETVQPDLDVDERNEQLATALAALGEQARKLAAASMALLRGASMLASAREKVTAHTDLRAVLASLDMLFKIAEKVTRATAASANAFLRPVRSRLGLAAAAKLRLASGQDVSEILVRHGKDLRHEIENSAGAEARFASSALRNLELKASILHDALKGSVARNHEITSAQGAAIAHTISAMASRARSRLQDPARAKTITVIRPTSLTTIIAGQAATLADRLSADMSLHAQLAGQQVAAAMCLHAANKTSAIIGRSGVSRLNSVVAEAGNVCRQAFEQTVAAEACLRLSPTARSVLKLHVSRYESQFSTHVAGGGGGGSGDRVVQAMRKKAVLAKARLLDASGAKLAVFTRPASPAGLVENEVRARLRHLDATLTAAAAAQRIGARGRTNLVNAMQLARSARVERDERVFDRLDELDARQCQDFEQLFADPDLSKAAGLLARALVLEPIQLVLERSSGTITGRARNPELIAALTLFSSQPDNLELLFELQRGIATAPPGERWIGWQHSPPRDEPAISEEASAFDQTQFAKWQASKGRGL